MVNSVSNDDLLRPRAWVQLRGPLIGSWQGRYPCLAGDDAQRQPAGRLRHLVQRADHEGARTLGLHDFDLKAVAGTDRVGRAVWHAASLRRRA